MRSRLGRLLWASVLGLGVMAGLARAADIVAPPSGGLIPLPGVVSPPSGYAPPPHGPLAPPPELPSYPTGHWWRFHDWHQPPTGCWAHHNLPRCGNLKAECTFIFGSCRAFYGEPCLKGRPLLPPVPVSSLRVPGFGPGEVGMGGCACSP